ncbi:MAG: hypothetical protein HYX48_01810 [Chlamydiales bacterium]|nr:hypothetical protein [Chlamydiales bacterium]
MGGIASLPHREHLVAEIYYNNMYWVQISQETEVLEIQFYSHPTAKCWEFSLDEALEILKQAKRKLIGL